MLKVDRLMCEVRAAQLAAPIPNPLIGVLEWELNMRRITEAQAIRFKHDWLKGRALKLIAEDLGLTERYLRTYRMRASLPRRKRGEPRKQITICVPAALYTLAKRRAHVEGMSTARYVTNLIVRDTGGTFE